MSDSYHHGNLERALLDSAERLLREQGPKALTLRACARAAGVSHAAPAHHFGNLEGLLTALAVQGFARMGAAQQRAALGAPSDAAARRAALGMAYIDFALDAPALFALMFSDPRVDHHDPRFIDAANRASGAMADAIGTEPGSAREPDGVDAQVRWLRAWSLVHGFCVLANAGLIGFRAPDAAKREGLRAVAQAMLRTDLPG